MSTQLSIEELKRCLPREAQSRVTPEVLERISQALADPNTAEMMRNNLIGYTDVLKEGKYKLSNYVDAVRYVSFKQMNNSNIVAFVKTFPEKYNEWKKAGVTDKDISSYVHAYNKSKLVMAIYEKSLVPVWLLNAEAFQEAVNCQLSIIRDPDVSPKVKSDAANSLMVNLKRPEEAKVKLSVDVTESDAMRELRELNMRLAHTMAKQIESGGMSPKEVAEARIIQGECDEVDNG